LRIQARFTCHALHMLALHVCTPRLNISRF